MTKRIASRRARAAVLASVFAVLAALLPAAAEEGALWVPALPSQYQGWTHLSLFDDGTGYAYRTNQADNGPLFVTSDFGATWTVGTTPNFGAQSGAVRFGSPEVGYGIAYRGLFRSTDGAATWAPVDLPVSGAEAVTDAYEVVDADNLVLGRTVTPEPPEGEDCTPVGLNRPELAFTHDRGQTWTTEEIPDASAKVKAVAVDGERTAVLTATVTYNQPESCASGASTQAGDTVWLRDPETGTYRPVFSCPLDQQCRDLAWAGDALVAAGNLGWIYRSADGGQTWEPSRVLGPVSATVPDYPYAGGYPDGIAFADEEVGYASFNANGVWRTDDAGATWVHEASTHEVLGAQIGSIAVADRDHVLAGGPTAVIRRVPPLAP